MTKRTNPEHVIVATPKGLFLLTDGEYSLNPMLTEFVAAAIINVTDILFAEEVDDLDPLKQEAVIYLTRSTGIPIHFALWLINQVTTLIGEEKVDTDNLPALSFDVEDGKCVRVAEITIAHHY